MAQKRFLYSKSTPRSGAKGSAGQDAGMQGDETEVSIKEKIFSLLRSSPLVNSVVALAIGVGFVHGWLKIRFPSPVTTFAFDALLSAALFLVFFQEKKIAYVIPPGRVGDVLKAFYVVCAIYLVIPLPDSPPMLIALAAARGWCFATLMYTLGYKVTRSISQVKGYFYLVIFLGVFTAIYGIRQTPEEVEKMMQENANFAERYQNTYYQSSKGRQLRRFSTFVSSGAFGSTMAYVVIFGLALMTDPRCPKFERLVLVAAIVPAAYGVVLSGSRSPLISLGCGFAVIAWHRRNFVNFVLVPVALVLLVKFAAELTGGTVTERYSSLLHFDEIWYRQTIPTGIGWDFMMDNLLGGGIGRSGHSVPLFFSTFMTYDKYVSSDGDLGRLMIDMGVIGLIFFGRLMWTALHHIYQQLIKLQDTPVSTLALASAACFVMAFVTLPSGSPFLGVPMGALVWFFMGTFSKLVDEHKRGAFAAEAAGQATVAPPKRFRYSRPGGNQAPGK